MGRVNSKLTYANTMATFAVFLALGGGAYAAARVEKNSVGSKQLKKGAVNSAKVKDGSLLAGDFKAGQLPAGERGPKGDPGPKGATSVVTRYGNVLALATSTSSASYAACHPGETVTGGGWAFVGARPNNTDYFITADRPSVVEEFEPGFNFHPAPADGSPASGWLLGAENNTGFEFEAVAYAQCASP
jgi:hypothetical protein